MTGEKDKQDRRRTQNSCPIPFSLSKLAIKNAALFLP
jgi:hypothetical protein